MRPLKPLFVTAIALLLVLALASPGACKVIYVNASRPDDTGDGLSWATAKKTVQASVNAAVANDEIWVAKGTYVQCISLTPGVSLYGGFAGTETQRTQRDWRANVTLLDGNGLGSVVAVMSDRDRPFAIDGFTIQNGKSSLGGGISCYYTSATIQNNTIRANSGGGICICSSFGTTTVSGNIICDNDQLSYTLGGGISCSGTGGTLQILANTIERNSAYGGGGVCCLTREATISENIIRLNKATSSGTMSARGGGIFASSCRSISNNVIAANYGEIGGGVYWDSGPGGLYSNTIVSNSADVGGGGIYDNNSSAQAVTVSNNIVAFNSSGILVAGSRPPVLTNNCIYNPHVDDYSGVSPGVGDISVDPKLVSVQFGQWRLRPGSPCTDSGNDATVQAGLTDVDGQPRVQGQHVDIGADESDGTTWDYAPAVFRVSPAGDDANDGSSWPLAKRTVQAAVDAASNQGGEVWVAAGTYTHTGQLWLKTYTYIYGGFAGNEEARDGRNWKNNSSILQGNSADWAVVAASQGTRLTAIDGFRIDGGGIVCNAASPLISNNLIEDVNSGVAGAGILAYGGCPIVANNTICNSGGGNRGGIYCASAVIVNNVIRGNSASQGAAICCDSGVITIANNIMLGNNASNGGAIYVGVVNSASITNNTIVANGATDGGAIYCATSGAVTIANNILAFNSSGIYDASSTTDPVLANNCLYSPGGYNYSGLSAGVGDICIDPGFVAVHYGQVHLQPGSPCINTGIDGAVQPGWPDMDGQPRVQGSHVDIGADESDGSTWTYSPATIRVSPLGSDANDGSTWALAKRTIQAALDSACLKGGEVWVSNGSYNERIVLRAFTYLYGAFDGTEGIRVARAGSRDLTRIEGQLNTTDTPSRVLVRGGSHYTSIDGFTIRDGWGQRGGGIYCANCSPTIANCAITNNTASDDGGAIYCANSSAVITDSVLSANRVTNTSGGGSIYCSGGSPVVSGNTIIDNSAGALRCSGSSMLTCSNNLISGNSFGITSSAAVALIMHDSITGNRGVGVGFGGVSTLSDCTIAGNLDAGVKCSGTFTVVSNIIAGNCIGTGTAPGAGIQCVGGAPGATIANNTIFGNIATEGGGVYFSNCSPSFVNNIVAFNSSGLYGTSTASPIFRSNCVYNPDGYNYSGLTSGPGDQQVNPRFASAQFGRLHIQPDSPCINTGDDSALLAGWLDIDGQPRLQGSHVDIGADEFDGSAWDSSPLVVRIRPSGNDANDGSTWPLAKKSIQAGIDAAAVVGGEVWVAAGTYIEPITLKPYAHIYGGFFGSESARDQRDWNANASVIEGVPDHITVTTIGAGIMASLDGFTLQKADRAIACRNAAPTITHNLIRDNSAGISCLSDAARIVENTISGNRGAGISVGTNSRALVYNNTITGNSSSNSGGGGIACISSAVPTIFGNHISNNSSYNNGGGIYCYQSSAVITGNTIVGNSTSHGGAGIYSDQCQPIIANNMLLGNSALEDGGGVYFGGNSTNNPSVHNNTIAGNTAREGGGIYTCYGSPSIANNIVAYNSSGIFRTGSGTAVTRNNCVHNPGRPNYSGLVAGPGDISLDPLLVDSAHGNYHLAANSPCVNSGWNDAPGILPFDFDGQTRIQGRTIDIGADERWPEVTDAKKLADNLSIGLSGSVVTAAFPDFLYVESPDRTSGIRVERAAHGLTVGTRADVAGTVQTNPDGERCIAAATVTAIGSGSGAPLALNNTRLGGGPFGYQGATSGARGPASGLNSIGLLVTTWGRVIADVTTPDSITIDDGSGVLVKCILPSGVSLDPTWSFVSVTGACSCEKVIVDGRDELHAVIRVRTLSDISPY